MNPKIISYLVFLVAIITVILAGDAAVVIDINGDVVSNGGSYYIGPVIWAHGGGIKLTDTKNNTEVCPFYVVQDPFEVNHGDLFSFTHRTRQGFLATSSILSIESGLQKGSCDKSTVWQIPVTQEPPYLVTTGGSSFSTFSCFQVVEYPTPINQIIHSYTLQYCPSCFNEGPGTCFNVGLNVDDEGVRYLGLGGTPFEFVFSKAISEFSKPM